MPTAPLLARERMRRVLERWFLTEPLLFALWQDHHWRSGSVQTLQVGAGMITYNPEFIDRLTPLELEAVMRCEAVRILLKHPYTRRQHPPHIAWQASNLTLREHLGPLPLPLPTALEVFGHHQYDRQFLEFYHRKLLEQSTMSPQPGADDSSWPQQTTAAGPSSVQPGGNGSDVTKVAVPTDTADTPPADSAPASKAAGIEPALYDYVNSPAVGEENTRDWQDDELFSDRINEQVSDAELRQRWGSLPGSLRERVLANRNPKLDYRSVLRWFHRTTLGQKRRLSRMKCNRRYGFLYLGSRYEFTTRLLVAVDVSGSMSNADISLGFSLINRFFNYGVEHIDVLAFDTEIQGEQLSLKRARREIVVTGRGGTSFDGVMDYIDQHPHYDGVIIITDGYASVPKMRRQRYIPLLWIFINETHYHSNARRLQQHGRVVFIRSS